MTPKQKKRLTLVIIMVTAISIATGLMIFAFQQNLNYFYSPQDVAQGKAPLERTIRVGGLVVPGSIIRSTDSLKIQFIIADNSEHITVNYDGILPDLFREQQGIIAKGYLQDNHQFIATEILAKHDETYLPPEVADALKRSDNSTKTD